MTDVLQVFVPNHWSLHRTSTGFKKLPQMSNERRLREATISFSFSSHCISIFSITYLFVGCVHTHKNRERERERKKERQKLLDF